MELMKLKQTNNTIIKVFGVGGGGGNAVSNMIEAGLENIAFISADTDVEALDRSLAKIKIQLGSGTIKKLKTDPDAQVGKEVAEKSLEAIREAIGEASMVFIAVGMGGSTGTGAAPVIAKAAKDKGALTVAVVTKPFFFEGKKRRETAELGILELKKYVDSLIIISNDRLISLTPKKAPMFEMFKKANEVLYSCIRSISDLIITPELINLDFRDIRSAMFETGLALLGTGAAKGEKRAKIATEKALTDPLLENTPIRGAKSVIINITASSELSMKEVAEVTDIIREAAKTDSKDVEIFFGVVLDKNLEEEMSVTVIATGIETDTVSIEYA